MSGPEEVERLVAIIADGVRTKMLRPKCLARGSWLGDTYLLLGRRVEDELRETEAELNSETTWDLGRRPEVAAAWARRVFLETCDVVAFGGMLADKASGRKVA